MAKFAKPKTTRARVNLLHALAERIRRPKGGATWLWAAAIITAAVLLWLSRDDDRQPLWTSPRVISDNAGTWSLPARPRDRADGQSGQSDPGGENETNEPVDPYAGLLRPAAPPPRDEDILARARQTPPPPEGTFRVAAVQVDSRLGNVQANREWLARYIRLAAAAGARVVAMPEAAVPGLADIERGLYWSAQPDGDDPYRWTVARVAEDADGPSVQYFADLCRELGIYLAVTFIEKENERYYSAAVLLDPDGDSVLHTRKRILAEGEFEVDHGWASAGDLDEAVAQTPYGRIGILLRLDAFRGESRKAMHRLGADLILNPTSLVMEQPAAMLGASAFWRRMDTARMRTSWVIANWAAPDWAGWEGHGASRVHSWRGPTVGAVPGDNEECVVIGDVPLGNPNAEWP